MVYSEISKNSDAAIVDYSERKPWLVSRTAGDAKVPGTLCNLFVSSFRNQTSDGILFVHHKVPRLSTLAESVSGRVEVLTLPGW